MARLLPAIKDVKTQLSAIMGPDGTPAFKRVRIWNNQLEYEKTGQYIGYPKPAVFVEVVNDAVYEQLGVGVQLADLVFRIHIIQEEYDAQNDGFDEDETVFGLRDLVCEPFQNSGLSLFQPSGFAPLTKVAEAQDYEHDNLYHYTIDFTSSFMDSTGSILDPANGNIIYKTTPTAVMVNATLVDSIDGVPNNTILKDRSPWPPERADGTIPIQFEKR